MTDTTLLKKKLLHIAATGKISKFTPQQLQSNYQEVSQFLALHKDTLDSIELFNLYELNFYSCILTNRDIEAKAVIDLLLDQFQSNSKSQRIKLLQSIYFEAIGEYKQATDLLTGNTDELILSKRLVTFSRNDGGETYIKNLCYYLDLQPSDLSAWSELAEEYRKLGKYQDSIYCLKEVLLHEPFAYTIFYKVGLLNYYQFLQDLKKPKIKLHDLIQLLNQARNNFLVCVEINEKYTKSWIGLYVLANHEFNQDERFNKVKNDEIVKQYVSDNDKLKSLVEKKVAELNIDLTNIIE
ncbi:ER membrane protein complex subunit 2 [Spathaspora sp. JA1]|nr:ER membrane protein complex subunit 2 [Spathaspora sp. JA1]